MSHADRVARAKEAIDAVYMDVEVSRSHVLASLDGLASILRWRMSECEAAVRCMGKRDELDRMRGGH